MMEQDQNARNLRAAFASSQETLEEAKKKSSEESSKKATYFRLSKDGTYTVRILPLAPEIDAEGNIKFGEDGKPVMPRNRAGYEFPLRSLLLKIEDNSKKKDGKPQTTFVTVPNAKYAFPNVEFTDLIDVYVNTACEKHSDDEKMCKKLREGSFSGGLKWDSKRCMYIIDLDNEGDGIQILQLSYSQYKDLEERKLALWAKLNKNGKVPCPISSIDAAFPVEIIRSQDGGKTKYAFNIDVVAGKSEVDDETLSKLINMPRLPENIYRYTRYHLEATICFLTKLDEKLGINIMATEAVKEAIEKIKMLLPADDNSHFVLGGKSDDSSNDNTANTLDALWDRYDKLEDADLDDATAEGQELRTSIKEFIEDNDLDIKITRKKANIDLLNEIEDLMGDGSEDDDEDEKEEEKPAPAPKPAPVDDDEDEEPAVPADDDEDDDEPEEPVRRRERNEDTNEPAVRASRRGGRPARRRV